MASSETKDLTFRMESSGTAAIASGAEYVCNVINMLFKMAPGTDDYNRDMGLDIKSYRCTNIGNGEHDSALETRIRNQLIDYTGLSPVYVLAVCEDGVIRIVLSVQYGDTIYNVGVDNTVSSDSLTTILNISNKKYF